MANEPPAVTPHLHYRDPAAAIGWLGRAFGFRELMRMERGDGDVLARLETPGGGVVMVSGLTAGFRDWMRERAPGFRAPADPGWPYLSHVLSVRVADTDEHYRQAQSAGAVILASPKDQPWGLRSYTALDLDGHQWEFFETLVAPAG